MADGTEHKSSNTQNISARKKKRHIKKIRHKRRNLSKLEIKSLFSEDEALAFLNRLAVTKLCEQKSDAALQTKAARQLMYLQVHDCHTGTKTYEKNGYSTIKQTWVQTQT